MSKPSAERVRGEGKITPIDMSETSNVRYIGEENVPKRVGSTRRGDNDADD